MKKIILFFILTFTCITNAQNYNALFDKARILYDQGKYESAINIYLKIYSQGQTSSALFFNLANAHYKNGDIAPSIYYYEKALKLAPNDNEIQNNLQIAKKKTIDRISPQPQLWYQTIFKTFSSILSVEGWANLALITMLLFVGSFLAYYILNSVLKRQIFFFSSFVFLTISVGSFFIGNTKNQQLKNEKYAILFEKEVSIFSEPNAYSSEVGRLHEGTKIQIIEILQEWAKIKLENGKTGWIKKNTAKEF